MKVKCVSCAFLVKRFTKSSVLVVHFAVLIICSSIKSDMLDCCQIMKDALPHSCLGEIAKVDSGAETCYFSATGRHNTESATFC